VAGDAGVGAAAPSERDGGVVAKLDTPAVVVDATVASAAEQNYVVNGSAFPRGNMVGV